MLVAFTQEFWLLHCEIGQISQLCQVHQLQKLFCPDNIQSTIRIELRYQLNGSTSKMVSFKREHVMCSQKCDRVTSTESLINWVFIDKVLWFCLGRWESSCLLHCSEFGWLEKRWNYGSVAAKVFNYRSTFQRHYWPYLGSAVQASVQLLNSTSLSKELRQRPISDISTVKYLLVNIISDKREKSNG